MHNREKMTGLKLLVLEDDSVDRLDIRRHLMASTSLRFDIREAATLEEALRLHEQIRPDAAILDLNLPDAEGAEIYDRFLALNPDLPVIILTGMDNRALALEMLRKGAEDYLVKGDLSTELLTRTVSYAIERSQMKRELARANRLLSEQIVMDPLTGLYNRRGFEEALRARIEKLKRQSGSPYILILDLDNFKTVNDRLGYAAGDLLLSAVSEEMRRSLRAQDVIVRIGGDEFFVILDECREAEALQIAQKLRLAVTSRAKEVLHEESQLMVTASVGMVRLEKEDRTLDLLFEKTRAALRMSKDLGKNRVSYRNHSGGDISGGEGAVPLDEVLFREDVIDVHFQPIVDLASEKPVAAEMLTRFRVDQFGMPRDFFRLAIESNLLTTADRLCFKRCIQAAARLRFSEIHLNLYPSTLLDVPVIQLLEEIVDPAPSVRFCIEISEQQIIGDATHFLSRVEELRRAGFCIALDDVGFGNSCLESLILLEPEIVKLDKACIDRLERKNTSRLRVLERTLRLLRSCRARLVAEGIENREQLEILQELGVERGQGYLFARPAPVTAFS